MTDEPTKPATIEEARELAELHPERFVLGVNNTLYDRSIGRIIAKFPSPAHDITAENSAWMRQRKEEIEESAKVRALAKKQGVDIANATPEELLNGYGSAQEALHGHAYDLVMTATSGRSIEGLYPILTNARGNPLVVVNNVQNSVTANMGTDTRQLEQLERIWRDVLHVQGADIVDAEAHDIEVSPDGDEKK